MRKNINLLIYPEVTTLHNLQSIWQNKPPNRTWLPVNKNIHEACTIVFWWIDLTLTKADQGKIQLDVNYSKSHSATR